MFYCHLSKGEFYNLFYARNLSHITTIIDKTYIKSEATISYRRGLRKCHTSSKPFYQRLDISNYNPSKCIPLFFRPSYTQTSSDLYNLIYDSNKYSLCWCPQSSRMNIWYKICVTQCSEKCLIRVLSLFSSFGRIRYRTAKTLNSKKSLMFIYAWQYSRSVNLVSFDWKWEQQIKEGPIISNISC